MPKTIVIAPDSFKGTMRSPVVCEVIAAAFSAALPDATIVQVPMADGGEGTTEAVVLATGGRMETVRVFGPLGEPVDACYGVLPSGAAVAEMASASGIELVVHDELNPMLATTFGTGELLAAMLDAGAREILLGIGGSATVDGGAGMAQALGYRLLDAAGSDVVCGCAGGGVGQIASIDASGVHPALAEATIRVACDVTNPLTGPTGAATIFGPQKGATPEMVTELDASLGGLMTVWQAAGMLDGGHPGDGAAGGLGGGLRAFCGAMLVSGAAAVAELVGLEAHLDGADLLITGEGKTDDQTAAGKLCGHLAGLAHRRGVPVLLISGALDGDPAVLAKTFDFAFSTTQRIEPLADCLAHAREDLATTAANLARLVVNAL